jgi:hypothetical protein
MFGCGLVAVDWGVVRAFLPGLLVAQGWLVRQPWLRNPL